MKIDHVMLGSPDLDQGIAWVQQRLGVLAEPGGSHDGAGTRNALVSLGKDVYLEILAPDPEQDVSGAFAEQLGRLHEPAIQTWAVRVDGFDEVIRKARSIGFDSVTRSMSRQRLDGVWLNWQLLFLRGHDQGQRLPFFIDWLDCPHPCDSLPESVSFQQFCVSDDERPELQTSMKGLGLETYVGRATDANSDFSLEVSTGASRIVIT